ncbi:hypothetical protein [Maricaulis sp.]|uniref:hypothetical protein n=1 Tax=Maricaulis sp. TaxID=1486257 RepID=UPI003A8D7FA0
MLRTLALCALIGFSLQSTAVAQDTTEAQNRINAAITLAQSGDLNGAAAETERAIAAAETLQDRFDGLYVLAQIRDGQERHREAAEMAERAAALVRDEPDAGELLQAALGLAEQAYYRAQDRDSWFRVGQELRALSDIELALFWRDLDSNPEHVFTAAHCPTRLGGAVRAYMSNLNATGTDEECQYMMGDIPAPRITVFMSRITSTDTLDALYDGTVEQINVAFNHPREVSSDLLDFAGLPVRRGIFAQGTTRTGLWLSLVHGWSLKLRLTHDGELTNDQIDAIAADLFADLPGIEAHLAHCDALAAGDAAEPGTPGVGDAVMLQLHFEQAELAEARQCFLGLPEFNNGRHTLAWSDLGADGEVLRYIAASRDPGSSYRVILAPGLSLTGPGSAPYLLASRNQEGLFLLGAFDSLPSPQQFIDYAERAAAGQLTNYASVTVDADGQTQISVTDAILGGSETE